MPRTLLAFAVLIALVLFRLGQLALGTWGLWQIAGPGWAALALLVLPLRWSLPVRIGIFLAAHRLLGWPGLAALAVAAPRLFLMLPGLASMLIARIRHPRPLWQPRSVPGT